MVLAIFSGKSTAVHSILNIGWWAEIYDDETPTFSNSCLSTLLDEFQLVAAVYVWNFNRSNILWRKFFSQCKLELVYIFLSCIWFFLKSETETTYFCWLASSKKRNENYDDGKTYLIKVKKIIAKLIRTASLKCIQFARPPKKLVLDLNFVQRIPSRKFWSRKWAAER